MRVPSTTRPRSAPCARMASGSLIHRRMRALSGPCFTKRPPLHQRSKINAPQDFRRALVPGQRSCSTATPKSRLDHAPSHVRTIALRICPSARQARSPNDNPRRFVFGPKQAGKPRLFFIKRYDRKLQSLQHRQDALGGKAGVSELGDRFRQIDRADRRLGQCLGYPIGALFIMKQAKQRRRIEHEGVTHDPLPPFAPRSVRRPD